MAANMAANIAANMATKKKKFDIAKEVKKLARERVGIVPPERVIETKPSRKIKHKRLDPKSGE